MMSIHNFNMCNNYYKGTRAAILLYFLVVDIKNTINLIARFFYGKISVINREEEKWILKVLRLIF